MICIYAVKKYCKEDPSMIENYDKAIADKTHTWDCHHRDEIRTLPSGMVVYRSRKELIENDRYYNCPANELIFLTKSEHNKLHNKNRPLPPQGASKGKTWSEFGIKFKEHYGITCSDDANLYRKEYSWYSSHNHKCRWEVKKE